MVIRKVLSATPGRRRTRFAASFKSILDVSNVGKVRLTCLTSRNILGGLPSNTDKSMSTGLFPKCRSATVKWRLSTASPTTAKGHRSRSQISEKRGKSSFLTAMT